MSKPAGLHALGKSFSSMTRKASECELREVGGIGNSLARCVSPSISYKPIHVPQQVSRSSMAGHDVAKNMSHEGQRDQITRISLEKWVISLGRGGHGWGPASVWSRSVLQFESRRKKKLISTTKTAEASTDAAKNQSATTAKTAGRRVVLYKEWRRLFRTSRALYVGGQEVTLTSPGDK